MFNTKQEVDRHVENCLKKTNIESERNLRCFAFSKLYFKVGDYEQARRYATIYLTAKPESAEAQQLLGRIFEKLGKMDAALEAYRTSLDLDPKQNKLVLKVCELLASDNINFDRSGARYFCEKAQTIDPNNPSIFSLKEKLMLSEGKDPSDITKLLTKELESRPNDVNIRVRLLRHYLQNNQIKEAYEHARNIEQQSLSVFTKNLSWYETVAEVLAKYQQDTIKKNLNWQFYMFLISVLDKMVELSLDERNTINIKTNNEYVSAVFNYDQSLKIAADNLQDCPDKNLSQEFLNHYRGQLCFHLITLVYKQAKRELIKYKEAAQITLPLLFAAYHLQPADLQSIWISHSPEYHKKLVQRWNREASFRCSQTGHMLISLGKDRKSSILEKATQCSSGLWREQLLKRIFVTRDHQAKIKSSYFATCNQMVELTIRLPDESDLYKFDDVAQLVFPDSLHHYVWIGLRRPLSGFKCSVFEGLPYSIKNLSNCTADSLSVLDVHAFVFCAVLCAQHQVEEQKQNIYYPNDRPNVVPAAVTGQLGTSNQAKWLMAAHKMFTNDYNCDFSEVRLTLVRGIETIRCVGNHGLDAKLLVTLAKIFAERSKTLEKSTEIEQNDARAELYWKIALPLLEKLRNNQTISYSPNRLFECKTKEMPTAEIQSYIDDGKLFNGVQLMKKKEFEKALVLFEALKDPYASYYQAHIYKTKAEEQTSRNRESVTSEMRSQNIILLSRARDCLYLTFDRLRDPSVDRRHPLNSLLGTEIDKIERMLSRIDPDTSRNDCDGMSEENMSSLGSMGDHFNYTTQYGNSSFIVNGGNMTPKNEQLNLNSTPLRLDTSRREARPSPERLDAQLRQLLASKDTAVTHILEQNKFMMESHRALLDEIRGFKDAVNHLNATVDEMKTFKSTVDEIKGLQRSVEDLKHSVDDLKNVTDDVLKMKKEIAELRKDTIKMKNNQISDEDLYGLEEEYNNEYGMAMNNSVAGLASNLYPSLNRLQPPPPPAQYAPSLYPGMYPMLHYPGLGLPQPGSLPYATDNQLADFRAINNLAQGLGPAANAYLQPGFPQTAGLAQSLAASGLTPGLPHPPGLPQTIIQQPSSLGMGTGHLPHSTLTIGQSTSSSIFSPSPAVNPPLIIPTIPAQNQSSTIGAGSLFSVIQPPSSASNIVAPPPPPLTTTSSSSISFLSNTLSLNTTNKDLPVNVVITSSDPLPPTKSTPQPILSVTIPPQHLKGGQKSQQLPHNYQIQLPISSSILPLVTQPSVPSVISQVPMPISTQSLLSNVAPPIYSALEKSPSAQVKSVPLGLAIEKSLSNSFGSPSTVNKKDLNMSNVSSASLEEHDPCPDFKPLIPLPDEVPVNTGEENETVLFEERAKLFRYTNKEWRERGVGVLKLLRNATTGRVRILMRRDQVHKICANHFLTKDMVLSRMPNNEKAYVWAANDFADQEIVLEKLCVRFKTPEIAQKYFKAFEEAKLNLTDPPETTPITTKSNTADNNDVTISVTSSLGGFVFTSPPTFKPKRTSPPSVEIQPKEVIKPSPFAAFTFTKPPTTVPSTIAFSSPVMSDFKPVVQTGSVTSKKTESTDDLISTVVTSDGDDSNVETDEYEPPVDFKPVVPLPELVEVKTGEENAEVLFEQKAKLLRFDAVTKEWKERGVGLMKVLKYEDTIRLLMRREQVHKVCCNHQLLKVMDFSYMPKNTKALNWCAQDFSEGVAKLETFALKFKTEQQAKQFHSIITAGQAKLDDYSRIVTKQDKKIEKKIKSDNSKKAEPSPTPKHSGWGDKYKPKSGSWECKVCYVVNEPKANLCTACETPKNENAAKKELNTSGPQFSFGVNKVQGSESVAFGFAQKSVPDKDVVPKPSNELENSNSGWGNAFKPPTDSWECKTCYIRNTKDKLHCASCESPKDDTVPQKETTSSIKGINLDTPGFSFSFGVPSSNIPSAPANTPISNISFTFGTPITKSPATTFSFGSSTVPETKQFTFNAKPDAKSEDTKKEDTKVATEDHDQFVFGSPQKHTFDFTPRSPRRHSSGQGGEEESEGSYFEEEEDNIYFKPVIPLPEKVDVKTGEEQEEVLYCHRAKLFRFTDGEWKERGLGDVKVLRMADTKKLRVVMRREQVLKVCLNHMLTKDITYTLKDEKNWLFCAPDYSESEIQLKQFCLKFKNADIAQDFKKAIDAALNDVDLGSGGIKSDDSDVEIVFETKVTPEEEEEAKKLGLPPKFMSYRQLKDCDCEECKRDDVLLKEILSDSKTTQRKPDTTQTRKSESQSSVGSIFGTPQSSSIFGTPKSDMTAFSSNLVSSSSSLDQTQNTSFMSTSSPTVIKEGSKKEDTLKDLLIKPSLFGNTIKTNTPPGGIFPTPPSVNAAVSFGNSKSSDVKSKPTTTGNDSFSKFTFILNPDNDKGTFTNVFDNNAAPVSSRTSEPSLGTPKASNIFNVPSVNNPTGSIFSTPTLGGRFSSTSSSGNIFGGTTTKPAFGSGSNIFAATQNTSTPTESISKTSTEKSFVSTTTAQNTATNDTNKNVISFTTTPAFGSGIFTNTQKTENTENKTIFGSGPIFGTSQSKPLVFGNTAASATLTFGSSSASSLQAPLDCTLNSSNKTEEKKFDEFLKCDPDLSFASLAAKDTDTSASFANATEEGDSSNTPFAFMGAGAPVFCGRRTQVTKEKTKTDDGTEKEKEESRNDEEYDPHYEPIVPLPEVVVVSTGEEDETALFNERTKLYRYDVALKEWKERGVGQLKILHHPMNHTYRLLLRREQVHKVVLNQLITTDLDLQPMFTTEKAWCWGGYNYSEDEHCLEKLAARFKTAELSKRFYETVQECIKTIREHQQSVGQKLIPSTLDEYVVGNASGDEDREDTGGEDVEGEEDEEDLDYYDDDDDERTIMFRERCTLSEQLDDGWKLMGTGIVTIYYDSEIYGTRIVFTDEYNILLSNTLIGAETVMTLNGNCCTWRAVQLANNLFEWRQLQAVFESEEVAEHFHLTYQEGVTYAEQGGIIDHIPTSIDRDQE